MLNVYKKAASSSKITAPKKQQCSLRRVAAGLLPLGLLTFPLTIVFIFQAEAMYPYQSSDDDELNFFKGDIIYVVEFPDPEEQVSAGA